MLQAIQTNHRSNHLRELRTQRREAIIRLHGAHEIVTNISGPDAEDREELETFIRDVFFRAHQAHITHFMPRLMSLRDNQGRLLAVCGLRHASESPLFLETYLDKPIEKVLSQRVGTEISRADILEVGNLAVAEPANARSLLASVSVYLHGTSTQWAVFTGIPSLKNSLIKLNMSLEVLGKAELQALPEHEWADWGNYYDENPQVMAIRRIQA